MKIIYSPKFSRKYKKLPSQIKDLAEKKEEIFRKNIFTRELETHKLRGKFIGFWAFSINDEYRIIFERPNRDTIHFHDVGDHSIYK